MTPLNHASRPIPSAQPGNPHPAQPASAHPRPAADGQVHAQLRLARAGFALEVAFELLPGRICALFGPSGSGKTSLLRALAGLEPQASGHIEVAGDVWLDSRHSKPTHLRALGVVFQEASLLPHLSVQQNLEYGWRRTPPALRMPDIAPVCQMLGLSGFLRRRPADLSGGERQRVALARALLTSPRLLLLDEAISSLDAASKQEIMPYLKQVHQHLAIPMLYVTHSMDEVMQLADDVILLERGQIVGHGPLATLLTRLDLPLAHGNDAESLVTATVRDAEAAFHLLHLDSPFGPLSMVHAPLPAGTLVKLRIRARDVSLSRHAQTDSSILNIFPVRIADIALDQPGSGLLLLCADSTRLLARITAKSIHQLELAVGQTVFAQIKGVALVQ